MTHKQTQTSTLYWSKIIISTTLALSLAGIVQAQSNQADKDGCWSGQDVRGNSCLVVTDQKWNKTRDRFQVRLKNKCGAAIYRSSCLQRTDKKPSCESSHLKPGNTTTHYTWNATGKVHAKVIGSVNSSKDWVCASKVSDWRQTPW